MIQQMIDVATAQLLIAENVVALPPKKLPLQWAAQLILAEDLIAQQGIPAFNQSNVDGYAFAWQPGPLALPIVAEVAAGLSDAIELPLGAAVRIFTGAPLPKGANTVVMQEQVTVEANTLQIPDGVAVLGHHVRLTGSEVNKDDIALQKGQALTPAAVGFAAGIGCSALPVYPKPKIIVIVSGNELQHPGTALGRGQVYESNSFALLAALQQWQLTDVGVVRAPDDLQILQLTIADALSKADVVLITGGVSVGDYDFTAAALAHCGVNIIFHGVKQKPGKPLLFGTKQQQLIFGLPGNPASVLSCFYMYVLPALHTMMHKKSPLQNLLVPAANAYLKSAGLTHFLKAAYDGATVRLLGAQPSYRLQSFATANCLAIIPENGTEVQPGALLDILIIPQ